MDAVVHIPTLAWAWRPLWASMSSAPLVARDHGCLALRFERGFWLNLPREGCAGGFPTSPRSLKADYYVGSRFRRDFMLRAIHCCHRGVGEGDFPVLVRPIPGRFGRNNLRRKALAEPQPVVGFVGGVFLVHAGCSRKPFPRKSLRPVLEGFR